MNLITLMMLLDSDSEDDAIEDAYFHEMEQILLLYRAAIELEGESSGDDASSEEDHQCIDHENSNRLPQVKWSQRLNKLYIKVQLAGAKDINVKLEPEGIFTFSATTGANNNSYELTLKLHDKVNVEESKITKGVGNVLCLLVKARQGRWKKLFSCDEETPHCIEVDWDRWVDEGYSNFENASVLDLFSKSQPSDKSKKEKSRKVNLQAEHKFQKRKSQKTSSKPISSAHKEITRNLAVPPSHPMLHPPCPSFNLGECSTGAVPHKNLIKSTLTQVGCVPKSKNCSWHSSLPTDNLLQQHIVKASSGAAAAVQLVQAIKVEREGLNCEIKAKNYELEQMRKEAQKQKAQLEEKVALLEVDKLNTQRSYKRERFEHLKKFKQEKAKLMEKFNQEMAETKTKDEAVANDIFYQVWRNNQDGNFSFLGQEVEKVIAGFKQRLAEETAFSNDAS